MKLPAIFEIEVKDDRSDWLLPDGGVKDTEDVNCWGSRNAIVVEIINVSISETIIVFLFFIRYIKNLMVSFIIPPKNHFKILDI